jgi:hypothetical protein
MPPRRQHRLNPPSSTAADVDEVQAAEGGQRRREDDQEQSPTTQIEQNTNREITFRIWCHQCERFTCASTLDEEHLPPICPACGEGEFLELVPFRDSVAEYGLFSEGPVWTEYEETPASRPSPSPARPRQATRFEEMLEEMLERAINGDGNMNFFDLDDRRFEQPLSENAEKEMLRRFTMKGEKEEEMDGKKTKKMRTGGNGNANEKTDTQCSVCLEEMKKGEEVCELKRCGHVFHNECVNEWFKTKNSCPVCRDVLETSATPRESPAARSFRNAGQQRRR